MSEGPYFIPGLYLTVQATGLRPGERYQVVWYGYRSDDDPAPVRYSFRPQPAPASGTISFRTPFAGLAYYAYPDVIVRVRSFLALAGSEVPVTGPDGQPMCAEWDTYQLGFDPCEAT